MRGNPTRSSNQRRLRMKFSVLKEFLQGAIVEAGALRGGGRRFAPTDPDAQVPGHLPDELPMSASFEDDDLDEEALVPGRWYGGEEPTGLDRERLGDPVGLGETDARMLDDGLGNGVDDPNDPDQTRIAAHLRGDEDRTCLGTPKREEMGTLALGEITRRLNAEIGRYLMQEEPAAASVSVDPTDTRGLYAPFDMAKDHMGTDDLSATWYRSPGRAAGEDGDPFRGADPYAQLGFHPPRGDKDPTASPPAADGEEGSKARRAPEIWQLNGGSDTSKMLGANAHGASSGGGGVGSGGGSKQGEEGGAAAEKEEPSG